MSEPPPTSTVHDKHKTWICEGDGKGTECNTYNDVNDLMCRKCYYEVDGEIQVKAADAHEMETGYLDSFENGVAKWQYYSHFLKRGPIVEDAPGNNAPVPRGTIPG
ncbi:uncharacterized protein FSUBG_8121 [Fusarium subglutinans]|uniref:Uncharacterized protein n=1 Tax=Gibberella subglutinans TaxID=42677 RepID=A0A8H5PRC2_GIBSU|nr:uncharacterized protein FSUBG_8121 [Fusarium subglutinans]KAF5601557.1 hypothetical protein FSUBG_8121 [Fusarium subglutinans]